MHRDSPAFLRRRLPLILFHRGRLGAGRQSLGRRAPGWGSVTPSAGSIPHAVPGRLTTPARSVRAHLPIDCPLDRQLVGPRPPGRLRSGYESLCVSSTRHIRRMSRSTLPAHGHGPLHQRLITLNAVIFSAWHSVPIGKGPQRGQVKAPQRSYTRSPERHVARVVRLASAPGSTA